ncbi:MAG TPA: hypothetical protein DCS89_11455 [Gammaproteobacteria bacterium]|jgi:hypothetical protein|nr:hypothetical protein [Gammaproteobacteria bacterium]HAT27624.1 hypothetical protein [Gammaproteobacteria bacterium]HIF86819.1 hypothetical protein [Gammaproteobacteria bacterium]HIL63223.1 hypothetical protein [Porticoccaceae bacterium]|tara:strand:- start:3467 stop:4471 length:1005 start_codon:yes stop_codon:yes gene_type:complete
MKTILRVSSSLLLLLLITSPALAQSDGDWQLPRTIDGHPDFQGVWENNTITPVERPEVFGDKEILTDEDVAFLRRRLAEITAAGADALFGEGVLAAAFAGEIVSYDPTTGNYDSQWMVDRTIHRRTSQIIDPPDGKYPPRTERAIAAARELREHREAHPADTWLDRHLGERCVSFGAPRLGSGYNSYQQIVQTRDTVAIIQEMAHDVRIIPLVAKPHVDANIQLWHGDSRGWWDGDTLVIETTNYSAQSSSGPDTVKKVNVERLTRISESEILYQFTSNDPGTFTAPYTREITFDKTPDKIYEYACHEGNYGMMNILSGHRQLERVAAAAANEN